MHICRTVLCALALAASGAAANEGGLSLERSGLGFKAQRMPLALSLQAVDGEAPAAAYRRGVSPYASPAGPGFHAAAAAYYPLVPGWVASLEIGVAPATLLAPRRYSLSGQVHTGLAGGSTLSVGLKYRVYEPEFMMRAGDSAAGAYGLVPPGLAGSGSGASYQLQVQYQYSDATTFGLALGRDVDTLAPLLDPGIPGGRMSFTGQHWLTPSWAFSYDVLSSEAAAFKLNGLRFGVRYRF